MEMEQILATKDEFGVSDYSDDDSSIDESIKASIERIRKEASRMDLYIALDQIDSLQEENGVVKSTLRDREAELEILKEKVSSLTMERDLLEVDTNNLKEDMATLVDKMFEISCVAGNSSLPDSNHSVVDHDDNLSQEVVETDTVPPDVMILNERFTSFESNPSQSDDKLHVRRMDEGVDGMITVETKSNSSTMERTCSRCSATTENRESPVVGSISEYQRNKRLCFVPFPLKKKSDEARLTYTLRPVERKRTISRRLIRWLTSCSRSKQVAAMQDQLDQLQSMIRMSIATTEQLQMRMEHANQHNLVDSPSHLGRPQAP